ncbi:hypothetical protein BaRGS_00028801 [Batillaria attramentaria]|uniref:Uncharacterized protein n=1 Tax=Batillaria attramentaria TaxID=370345 RepID=A0ABD0JYA3_9CAEN
MSPRTPLNCMVLSSQTMVDEVCELCLRTPNLSVRRDMGTCLFLHFDCTPLHQLSATETPSPQSSASDSARTMEFKPTASHFNTNQFSFLHITTCDI